MRLIDADKLKQHYAWWNDENKELFDTIVDAQPTVEMQKNKCDSCMNGWARISENGYSTKCTLSQKKAISCLTGVKSHYVERQDMRKVDDGKMKEKLIKILADYFELGDTYAYNLTRDKRAFAVGAVTIDDFEEFNMNVVADIVDFLIKNGVTIDHPTEKVGVQE